MISRQYRFHGLGSLNFVYKRGQTVRSANIGLRYIPNRRRKQFRAAVVVSRKVNKSAVVRNRIRRRVYEALRLCQADIQMPMDMVFTIYNDGVATMTFDQLHHDIEALIHKATSTNSQ